MRSPTGSRWRSARRSLLRVSFAVAVALAKCAEQEQAGDQGDESVGEIERGLPAGVEVVVDHAVGGPIEEARQGAGEHSCVAHHTRCSERPGVAPRKDEHAERDRGGQCHDVYAG